jgi:putative N6-adenine-specific DNA methylase
VAGVVACVSNKRPDRPAPRLEVFAVAAPGVAPLLAQECLTLGFTPLDVTDAGVALSLTPAELFALNCHSRLATRVLRRLAQFPARDFATLEKQAARVPWAQVLSSGTRVRLRVTCRKSRLYHSDAVAERIARGVTAAVPGVQVELRARDDEDAESPEAESNEPGISQLFVVRLDHDQCTISADSSGALLHRRGWRQAVAKAPLRETLAALLLAAFEWDGDVPLVDPFCGSGTIGIEAALRARRIAPGLHRSFAMEQWPGADTAAYAKVRERARDLVRPNLAVPIVLRDRDTGAIAAARANAERAGVQNDLDIAQAALSSLELSAFGPTGLLLTNPPYGHRVSEGADLRGLYARLGDVLRSGGRAWRLGLFMPNDRVLLGQLRVRVNSLLRTTNGGLPVEIWGTQPPRRQTSGQTSDQTRK